MTLQPLWLIWLSKKNYDSIYNSFTCDKIRQGESMAKEHGYWVSGSQLYDPTGTDCRKVR